MKFDENYNMTNKYYVDPAIGGYAHAMINKLIYKYGTVEVLRMITKGLEDGVILAESEDGKVVEVLPSKAAVPNYVGKIIDNSLYGGTADCTRRKFDRTIPEEINDILRGLATELHLDINWYGFQGNRTITHARFAEFILMETDRDTLKDVLYTLSQCYSWIRGRGISRFKMEMVFHVLMLHQGEKEDVKRELIKILNNYDQESLKVTANQDDDFRNTLSYEAKMIAWVEKQVCEALSLERKFDAAAA